MFKTASRRILQWFIGAVCFLCLSPVAFAQQFPWWTSAPWSWTPAPKATRWPPAPKTLSVTGKADHELIVGGAGDGLTDCAPVTPPVIDLDAPPSHGIVCLRPADYVIAETYGFSDHCLGRKTSGVYVIYLPRHGYTGADSLRYTVRHSRGPATSNLNLTIAPDTSPSPGALPADFSAPGNDPPPQSLGPIPACAALVS
jgi:hypothetical protein